MSEMLRDEANKANLTMIVPELIPKSRRALEASEYVREQNKHEQFHKIVFQKFYGEGQDLGSWSILAAAAAEVDVDASEMQAKTESGLYAEIVDQRLAELQSLGASGVPLFIFDSKYAVIGLQPYDAFEEVMAHIIQT